MPILPAEYDLYPLDLFESERVNSPWWAIYTRSRQEKQLMRRLRELEAAFYSPVISRRYRSPSGRVRESFLPLFPNYVFLCGDNDVRYQAVCTGTVSRCIPVDNPEQLISDLNQIRDFINTGAPLAPEAMLEPGDVVRVKSGQFAGFEGTILRRQQETRLVVAVRFMNQGASVLLEDCQLEFLRTSAKC